MAKLRSPAIRLLRLDSHTNIAVNRHNARDPHERQPPRLRLGASFGGGMIERLNVRSGGREASMRHNHEHSDWEAIVLAARERASARQATMVERFGLAGDVQYHWSMDEARITWSRSGTAFLSGRITMIGSVSVPQQTWLWSWANPSIPAPVLGEVDQVRRYGEANDFPVLPWKSFKYHPDLVTEARVVAASVLDAEGFWFDDLGDVQLHFLVHELTPLDKSVNRSLGKQIDLEMKRLGWIPST